MRIILTVLILIFNLQSLTKADDIKNFEIEGMTIGESALKYFDEKLIIEGINDKNSFKYKQNKFVSIGTINNYANYDSVGIVINPNDKNYIIYALEGTLNFGKKIDKCYKQQKIIEIDIDNLLGEGVFKETWSGDYSYDPSGKSKVKYIDYNFDDGSAIRIVCFDMDDNFNDPIDQLVVIVNSKQFMQFINTL